MIKIENIHIDEDYYSLLLKFLSQETNLNFKYYRRKFVERRLKARMIRVNCSTVHSYYYYIKDNKKEIENFLDGFNINYSCFFRNWKVFQQFENFFLKSLKFQREDIFTRLTPDPNRIKQKSRKKPIKKIGKSEDRISFDRLLGFKSKMALSFLEETVLYKKINNNSNRGDSINIWSCPCASGEEPYSIAMILDNLKKQIPGFPRFKIYASDIDRDAINKARIGIYNENVMKEVSKYNEKNYFNKVSIRSGFKYSINESLKEYIEFIEEDVTKELHTNLKYDIIFCRYLLIYINQKLRNKFLSIIENCLNPGGLLILGKTETLFNSLKNLKLIDPSSRFYLKIE